MSIKVITAGLLAVGTAFFALNVNAAVVWNESTDGDLTNDISVSGTSDFGILSIGTNTILGSVDSGTDNTFDGPDEFDSFQFTANGEWSFSAESIIGDPLASFLYEDTDNNGFYNFIGSAFLNNNDVFGSFTNSAGTYAIGFSGQGNSGSATYELALNVSSVPIPAAAWLFGSALFGLSALKRKAVTA